MKRKILGAVLIAFALAGCAGDNKVTAPAEQLHSRKATGTDAATGASISTNQNDYLPGEIVHLTGAGWGPGETVNLHMSESPDTHADVIRDVEADGTGAFSIHFYDVQQHDLGVTFTLVATGLSSGSRATVVFTDGRAVSSATLNGLTAVTVAPSASISANVIGALTGNSNNTLASIGIRTYVDGSLPATSVQLFCYNVTPDKGPSSPGNNIPFNETFAFNAPAASNVYDVLVITYEDDACSVTSGAFEFTLNNGITVAAANAAPVLGAIGNKSVVEGNLLAFTATATDDNLPAPPTLSYTLANPASGTFPAGATIGLSSGVFNWTPTEAQGPGTYRVKVIVSDGLLTDEEEIEIGVTEGNAAPVLTLIGNKNVNELALLSFSAAATDSDLPANTLTFSLGTPAVGCGFPIASGAAITGGGAFTWTPTEAQGPGTFCARIQVSDGTDTDFEDIQIVVAEVNAAPVLTPIGNKNVDELALLSFSAAATDPDVPPNTLTFSLGTPVGCGFPIASGALITGGGAFTWTPTEAQGPGTFCARIQVTDGTFVDFEDIQIVVAEVNVAPVLTPIGNKGVDELALLSFSAAATDSDLPANTLTFSLGTPVGCGFPIAAGAAITTGGAFTWTPTEAQGPGTFCARIQVFDGTDTDFEDIQIVVAEVNVAPVLTVPAAFSVNWGVAISGKSASATDADIPANTLTFSLIAFPLGMTINPTSGLISWTPTSGQIGPHTIRVRVTDNGLPSLYDEDPTFVITVTAHATSLVYNGKTTGQYSDQAKLSATLTDQVTSTAISGQSVSFTFNALSAGSANTDATGKAEVLYTVVQAAGNYNVAASYAGSGLYTPSSSPTNNFVVTTENASIIPAAGNVGSIPVSQTTLTLVFNVKETNPEPVAGDGALAGNIANAAATLTATLTGIATGPGPSGVCTPGAVSGSGYSGIKPFTCVFTGPFDVDAYTINLSTSNNYYAGTDEDVISVYDPDAGFVTGGGKFIDTDDNRVSFGMSFTYTGKGKTGYRGGWVVVKHFADGSICRVKSNSMNAPAVNGNTASLSGKSNYSCTNALGVQTASQGNLSSTGYVVDGGTSGAGVDKFWINAASSVSPASLNTLNMAGPAATAARLLTGGNIQVPQPGR